jgi:hypothetical protein
MVSCIQDLLFAYSPDYYFLYYYIIVPEIIFICQHHHSLGKSIVYHCLMYYLGLPVCVDHTLFIVYYNICTLQFFLLLIYKEFRLVNTIISMHQYGTIL